MSLDSTVLDGYSPLYGRVLSGARGPEKTYPAGKFREAVARVFRALDVLESACEPARAMLDACVRVMVLDRVPAEPDRKGSSSARSLPGMARIKNVHSGRRSPECLMNALLHEGIHALLYKVHMKESLYTTDRGLPRITVVSPWSGRSLGVHTFTHACLVWFGLQQPDVIEAIRSMAAEAKASA